MLPCFVCCVSLGLCWPCFQIPVVVHRVSSPEAEDADSDDGFSHSSIDLEVDSDFKAVPPTQYDSTKHRVVLAMCDVLMYALCCRARGPSPSVLTGADILRLQKEHVHVVFRLLSEVCMISNLC